MRPRQAAKAVAPDVNEIAGLLRTGVARLNDAPTPEELGSNSGKTRDEVKQQSLAEIDLFSYLFSSYFRTFHVL